MYPTSATTETAQRNNTVCSDGIYKLQPGSPASDKVHLLQRRQVAYFGAHCSSILLQHQAHRKSFKQNSHFKFTLTLSYNRKSDFKRRVTNLPRIDSQCYKCKTAMHKIPVLGYVPARFMCSLKPKAERNLPLGAGTTFIPPTVILLSNMQNKYGEVSFSESTS